MGASSSVKPTPTRRINVRENDRYNRNTRKNIVCKKHNTKPVTHYNEKTNELYCSTCYQEYRRRYPKSEGTVFEIDKYVTTINFKQTEVSLLNKLNSNKRSIEHQMLQLQQNKKSIENKKKQFIDEIKGFVKTLIDLLVHFEQDLCDETTLKINTALSEIDQIYSKFDKELEKTQTLGADIEQNMTRNENAFRVDTIINSKSFLKKNGHHDNKERLKHFEPSLKLHKLLTLSDIVGRKGSTNQISLGTITCNNVSVKDQESLSDISETSNETDDDPRELHEANDAPAKNYSSSRRLPSRTQSVSPSKRKSSAALLVHGENNEYTRSYSHNDHSGHTVSDEESTDSGYVNIGRFSNTSLSRINDDQRTSNTPRNESKRHIDTSIRIPSSSGKYSNPQTPVPRRSSQSIVSPGNISTPHFVTPRVGAVKDSMERRIAKKLKVITLARDERIHNITDTVFLDGGRLVLCDQMNGKLILMNDKQEVMHDIKVSGSPHNVTTVPGSVCKVAVTIPDENVVKIIQIDHEEFSDEIEVVKLNTKPKCRGIEYLSGHLVYTTRNDVVVQKKDDHNRPWKFQYAFRQPVSLCADRRKNIVYISCYGVNGEPGEIVKMQYENETIELDISCPEIKHPVCVSVDSEGYIYVCDVGPPSIHQVTSQGTYCRKLLGSGDGNFQHVNFLPGSEIFVVTENDSDCVHFYNMH
ncbi:hypothetical protein ACF0H5_007906 [Mactra antiquata]